MKFKVGDNVLITAGKDKGRKGQIEKLMVKSGRVLVKGVNLYKRHVKPRSEGQRGGILSLERPIPVGNIALICGKCNKQTRAGYSLAKTGVKQRVCRKCGGIL